MLSKKLPQIEPNRKRRLGVKTLVAIIATVALAFLLSSAVVIRGCGVKTDSAIQDGQERPRRVEGENSATGQANKDKNSGMANKEKSGGPSSFYEALEKALTLRGTTPSAVCDTNDPVSRRVLEDYGAMFMANESVKPPPVCVFKTDDEVSSFQNMAGFESAKIDGATIELQPAAMKALLDARKEAIRDGLNITPRGGAEAARRSYGDTRRLWDTRFLPALIHWQKKGRLTKEQASRLRSLPLDKQVGEVLELEKKGIFFSKDLSKSILYSIAAPGTSQHIAMLALDVSQFAQPNVRRILAKHGWFQTVKSDLPHFTYLGVAEESLPSLGLHAVMSGEQKFWIPKV